MRLAGTDCQPGHGQSGRPHFPAETDTYAPQTGQARVSSTGGWRGADGPAPDAGCAGERRLVVGGGLPADPRNNPIQRRTEPQTM